MSVRLKRAYDPPAQTDGYRVLIDRLWPRGVTHANAQLDEWAKELAPSANLRRWFGHDPARFSEFRQRYIDELSTQEDRLRALRRRAREATVTLVYGARDTEHNDAVVLAELLRAEAVAATRPIDGTPLPRSMSGNELPGSTGTSMGPRRARNGAATR